MIRPPPCPENRDRFTYDKSDLIVRAIMLIECIGLPGSGKTTITAMLARHLRPWQFRGGEVRKFQYRWTRALNRLGFASRIDQPTVTDFVNRNVPDVRMRRAQHFNLAWRAKMVQAYQARSGPILSDELLIQGIFMAVGPLEKPGASLGADVEALILSIYRSQDVKFLHVDPPREQWLSQVAARRRGPSRFGRGSSADAMRSLERDRLFSDVILRTLKEHRFTIVPVREVGSPSIREIVAELT